jgi:molybdopterin/thiamine biosynthesis adenylyltransferase
MITLEESRYARQELITWWDQTKLRESRVLVVGAGALGNEIVKNLGLLGVGHITVVDMDRIERSNLARCAMFVDADEGRLKAEALAGAVQDLNPEVTAAAMPVSVMTLGLGTVASFDIVIAGLDNREARLWVNRACRKLGMAWVDGAIEGLRGLARVFLPQGACYECTLGEVDLKIMAARKSCALLSNEQLVGGKTPTNSTTASIIAAVEVQEAVKLLVGRPDLLALRNQAFVYTGDTMDTYVTGYTEDEWCLSHDVYAPLVEVSDVHRLADLLDRPEWTAGADSVELEAELVVSRRCLGCSWQDLTMGPLGLLGRGDGECPECQTELTISAARTFEPTDPVLQRPLAELRLFSNDVVTIRNSRQRHHYMLGSAP